MFALAVMNTLYGVQSRARARSLISLVVDTIVSLMSTFVPGLWRIQVTREKCLPFLFFCINMSRRFKCACNIQRFGVNQESGFTLSVERFTEMFFFFFKRSADLPGAHN